MTACKFCQIDIVHGLTDSNKCSYGAGYTGGHRYAGHCCNCFKEKIGWADYDKYACHQCKSRVA